jgi:hypothetical protein
MLFKNFAFIVNMIEYKVKSTLILYSMFIIFLKVVLSLFLNHGSRRLNRAICYSEIYGNFCKVLNGHRQEKRKAS